MSTPSNETDSERLRALPLSAEDEASFRAEIGRRPVGELSWTTHSVDRLLATLDRDRERLAALEGAARLPRNVALNDGTSGFSGNWVAVPQEDFEALRAALKGATS